MTRIRPAAPEDDAHIAAIDEATWSPAVTPGTRREPGSAFFGDRIRPEDVLVADADGEVAGYVILQQTIPLPSHEHVRVINGMAVAPDRQGRGLGRLLLEGALARAQEAGVRKVSLRVLATNPTARRLYEAAGFVVEGRLAGEFVLEGTPVDDLLMAWHATAPVSA